jgi:hypothetical protein
MPSKNWKPWWEKVGEFDTAREREEFMRGVAGKGPTSNKSSAILFGLVAGYVAVKSAQSKGKK